MKLIISLLISFISLYAKSDWYKLTHVDSIYELKNSPITIEDGYIALNADTSRCELVVIFNDSIEAKKYPICKSFNVPNDSNTWAKIQKLNDDIFKLPKGIYYILDTTEKLIQSIKIINDSVIFEIDSSSYSRYEKIKSFWYVTEKYNNGPGESYYSDSTYNGIQHNLTINNNESFSEVQIVKQWYTNSYYKVNETPSIKFSNGSKLYSYNTEWDSTYTTFTNTLNNKCNVECFGNTCYASQLFYDYECDENICDTIKVDTIQTTFKNINGIYVKEIYRDTIVNTVSNVNINYNQPDESHTSLNIVMTVDKSVKYDFCSHLNNIKNYGYKPISIYGSIDGIEIEGKCSLYNSKNEIFSCDYKDKTGKKYGRLIKEYPYSFINSETLFLCKDGKTSEGKYMKCSKVGL